MMEVCHYKVCAHTRQFLALSGRVNYCISLQYLHSKLIVKISYLLGAQSVPLVKRSPG